MAVVTLGKDMTFRDYAQGCWRMRGLGQGQTIRIFMIPEVGNLIAEQVTAGESTEVTTEQRRASIAAPALALGAEEEDDVTRCRVGESGVTPKLQRKGKHVARTPRNASNTRRIATRIIENVESLIGLI